MAEAVLKMTDRKGKKNEGQPAPQFRPPVVEKGDIVAWYASMDKEEDWLAALVTSVGPRSLTLNIFSPYDRFCKVEDGVRHKDDPTCVRTPPGPEGVWDLTPKAKREAGTPMESVAAGPGLGGE
jgi:hypothetical protein